MLSVLVAGVPPGKLQARVETPFGELSVKLVHSFGADWTAYAEGGYWRFRKVPLGNVVRGIPPGHGEEATDEKAVVEDLHGLHRVIAPASHRHPRVP